MRSKKRSNLSKWMGLILLSVLVLSGCEIPTAEEPDEPFTGKPVKVLVVMMALDPSCPVASECEPNMGVKVQAAIGTPKRNASDYMTILTKDINDYYNYATYGEVYFDFDLIENPGSANGWWDSPYSLAEINKNPDFKQYAVSIAYTAMGEELSNYDRLLAINNVQWDGGQTCCMHIPVPCYEYPGWFRKINLEDDNSVGWDPFSSNHSNLFEDSFSATWIKMMVAEVSENVDDKGLAAITSHELAHTLGACDQYYGLNPGMGEWDLMHSHWDFHHFGAWTKLDRGWLDWEENTTSLPCTTGSCEITTSLDPLETKKGNNALLVPILPFDDPGGIGLFPFTGFMAECRRKINRDSGISSEGVLVTMINPFTLTRTIAEVVSGYGYHPLKPGETYYNSTYGIRIINLSAPGDLNCTVRASRNIIPAPDLYIVQGDILEGAVYDRYRSPDIWNDTGINGFYTYSAVEKVKTIIANMGFFKNKNVTVPDGYGDPVSLIVENHARFLVHNGGDLAADDIRVNVFLLQPLDVSIKTENCGLPAGSMEVKPLVRRLLGTVLVESLDPDQSAVGEVVYTTASDSPMEIEVQIEPHPDELNTSNNSAYETYTHFSGQPYQTFEGPLSSDTMSFTLSDECTVGIPFMAMEEPAEDGSTCSRWNFSLDPVSGFINPGQTIHFNVFGAPVPGAQAGEQCVSRFSILAPLTSAMTPILSFGFQARVVDPSSLTCSVTGGSLAPGPQIDLTGQLNPGQAETIALVYTGPDGISSLKNIQTLSDGSYMDGFSPPSPGQWQVQAFWGGDATHAVTESQVCTFIAGDNIIPTPTPPASNSLYFTPNINANCRSNPDVSFPSNGTAMKGLPYLMDGRNLYNTWYRIMLTAVKGCWVLGSSGTTSGDPLGLRVLAVVPTVTPTPTSLSPMGCSSFTSPDACNAQSACEWIIDAETPHCKKK